MIGKTLLKYLIRQNRLEALQQEDRQPVYSTRAQRGPKCPKCMTKLTKKTHEDGKAYFCRRHGFARMVVSQMPQTTKERCDPSPIPGERPNSSFDELESS